MRLAMVVAGIALLVVAAVVVPCLLQAGEVAPASGYSLLSPIRSGNLTVFPVVASKSYDTVEFLTLDEGLRSGDVVVTEAGQARGLIRHRPRDPAIMHPVRDAEVNRLVLVNNSKRPLLLLAGEIVTGGKQDRVIGKDRIVPAESDPVDLSVFCVEPGRWRQESAAGLGQRSKIEGRNGNECPSSSCRGSELDYVLCSCNGQQRSAGEGQVRR